MKTQSLLVANLVLSIAAIGLSIASFHNSRKVMDRERQLATSLAPKVNEMRGMVGLESRSIDDFESLGEAFFGGLSGLYGGVAKELNEPK